MRVLIREFDRYGRPLGYDEYLCERHARAKAAQMKARWPEPHEHSASTWDERRRFKTSIRVLRDSSGPCERCEDAKAEVELERGAEAMAHERE